MISSPQAVAPKPALPPAAAPAAAAANPAGGPSFAQFLNEQSAPPAAPVDTDDGAAPADPNSEPTQAAGKQAAARRAAQAQAQGRHNTPERPADPVAQAATPLKPEAAVESPATDDTDGEDAPDLKEFTQLIGLVPPPAAAPTPQPVETTAAARSEPATVPADPTTTAAAATAGPSPMPAALAASATPATVAGPADTAAAPAAEAAPRERRATPTTDPARSVDAADAGRTRAAEPRAEAKTGARSASLPIAADSQAAQDKAAPLPTTPAGPATASFASALAQALPTPIVRTDATPGALPTAAVQAPLHSAAFAPELGTRVSLLAVDGVQRAELQLNPAEMGPVSVQIVLDGSQAQVSFHAQQSETRQALEQSLPELAAALQGQGLTLSGGGVFQQAPRDADPGARDAGTPAGTGTSGRSADAGPLTEVTTAAAPARRSLGLLDAFA